MSEEGNRERLIQLIRQVAREEACEAIDEHLNDYEHKQKSAEEEDLQ